MGKKNLAVIFGGRSSEHEVSCISVVTVAKAVDTEKYNMQLIGITKDGKWLKVNSIDEIEAGISEENRKLISQNFFKTLQTIIPKVIVVTPMNQQEFYIESNHEYFIHLENNESVMESRK